MAGGGAEGEVNHWPAFVDVLTTVIMVVTFLLVIMSAAVMVLSQRAVEAAKREIEKKYEKMKDADPVKAAASQAANSDGLDKNKISSPVDAEAGSSIASLGSILKSEELVNGQEKLTIRTRETPDTMKVKVKALEEENSAKGVEVKIADVLLRVDFEPMAVRYDDANAKAVMGFLKSKMRPGMKYEVWSFAPQISSLSEAQRLAFYRAAMTRNLLIQAGINPSDVNTQVRVTDPTSKDGANVRVVLKP